MCIAIRTIYSIHYTGTAAEDWPSISINKNTDRSHKTVLLRFVMFPSIVSYKWQAIGTYTYTNYPVFLHYIYVVRSVFSSRATLYRVVIAFRWRSSHVLKNSKESGFPSIKVAMWNTHLYIAHSSILLFVLFPFIPFANSNPLQNSIRADQTTLSTSN